MSPDTVKLTATIDRELYNSVTTKLHHGQMTAFQRKLFLALKKKIQAEELMEIIEFIYKDKPLTLGE